jgi:CheY-like chemotaxis protein
MIECPKILIIENDDQIRKIVAEILESEGFSVETFADGQLAISRLQHNPESCLILLDLLMPVMNGWNFMKEFAKLPVTIVPIPVYIFSVVDSRESTKTMGADGFIKKPVDLDLLVQIVKDHCDVQTKAA